MKVHAIQTGFVRIKSAQVEGHGHGLARRLAIFTDRSWIEWLPTYAWVIDHREGIIVVDTGQGTHLLETGKSLHPYVRWKVAFRIDGEEEIGPQLRALGIGSRDVKRVVLTHLHMDHDGGLAHFPQSEILVAPGELRTASGWLGRLRGYVPNRWPAWFDPLPLDLAGAGRIRRQDCYQRRRKPSAQHFTICDHWFSSLPGPTWPNRFMALTGTAKGRVNMPGDGTRKVDLAGYSQQDQDTIFDRLDENGISWKSYFHDIPQSWVLRHQRRPH